ncbi:hypothetical protein Tco_0025296 [Tanacetum coccineum]
MMSLTVTRVGDEAVCILAWQLTKVAAMADTRCVFKLASIKEEEEKAIEVVAATETEVWLLQHLDVVESCQSIQKVSLYLKTSKDAMNANVPRSFLLADDVTCIALDGSMTIFVIEAVISRLTNDIWGTILLMSLKVIGIALYLYTRYPVVVFFTVIHLARFGLSSSMSATLLRQKTEKSQLLTRLRIRVEFRRRLNSLFRICI